MKHNHYICGVRWDITAIDSLPDYMKLCFLALYNFINEMAFNTLKEKEYNAIPQLKKVVGSSLSFSIYIYINFGII